MTPTLVVIVVAMVFAILAAGLLLYRRFDRETPANAPDGREHTDTGIRGKQEDFRKRA